MNPVTTSLLCLVGWLNAYLQSTVVWNVWEALRMFSVSTAIEQEIQTEDKDYNVQHNNIIYAIVVLSTLLSCPCCNRFIHDAFTHYCNLLLYLLYVMTSSI